jgi:hypothetical protein
MVTPILSQARKEVPSVSRLAGGGRIREATGVSRAEFQIFDRDGSTAVSMTVRADWYPYLHAAVYIESCSP